MMQIVNDTDEEITLEPGEVLTGQMAVFTFNGDPYRTRIEKRPKVVDRSELTHPSQPPEHE